ncbi:SAP domain protein [Aspergillus sp. HF37]|nr:SAP domain protein [Aspergillus sp. HF37]
MAAEYAKKTNAELVEMLKGRSLPHNGKKAEMVSRLEEDDAKKAKSEVTAGKPDTADDVIDWDDDAPATTAPSTETGAAAIAAGGQGTVSNPAAVPNQQLGEDPAKTDDLKVEEKGSAAHNGATADAEGAAPAAEDATTQAEEKPAANFTRGLPVTEMEEELRKRKARAEKFGITEDSQAAVAEAEKQLERAKRFGTSVESNADVGVGRLDEALPAEQARRRQGGRGGRGRNFGRNNVNRRGRIQKAGGGGNGGQSSWSEKDSAALEARKQRFGAAA